MAPTPDSSVSPGTRSPRSPPTDAAKGSSSMFSRLRHGNSASDMRTPPAFEFPKRRPVKSNPASIHEGDEFPFDGSPPPEVPPPTNDIFTAGQTADFPSPSPLSNGHAGSQGPVIAPVSRRQTADADESDAAPKGRRSVQFARSTHSRNQSMSMEPEDGEGKGKEKDKLGLSLMTKLKALAAPMSLPGHGRSHSAFAGNAPIQESDSPRGQLSPEYEHPGFRFDGGQDSEADADAESAGEGPSRPPRRRRKSRRWFDDGGTQTAPTTPKNPKDVGFFSKDSPGLTPTSTSNYRPGFLRRGTMSDIPENQRQGVSEDEGRDRLAKNRSRTKGLHSARGMSYAGLRRREPGEDSEERRPSHLRRLTGFGGAVDGQPSPWRIRSERTSSLSAQKWRSLKTTLKMLGQTRRLERQADHAKSAELMAELLAGAPAALFLASMFQRDEHGHRRIPVLLEQLKVSVTDSYAGDEKDKAGGRHTVFRIELEYGSGLTRMKWVVHRSIRDFAKLHVNYKLAQQQERLTFSSSSKKKKKEAMSERKKEEKPTNENADARSVKGPKLPAFPVSAMPYLRSLRGFGLDSEEEREEEEAEAEAANASGQDYEASGTDRPSKAKRAKSSFLLGRRKSSIGGPDPTNGAVAPFPGRQGSFAGTPGQPRVTAEERQRKKLERYLNQMVAFLIFRPDSNRLCKFLELSALGVRLAAEGGYHGKEGFMMIKSSKGVDSRKKWGAAPMVQRHWPKWFLVRQSFVVCVDSPEEMNIYDVFLVDSDFSLESKKDMGRVKKTREFASEAKATATGHHQLRLYNAERKMKLLAKNERQLQQFEDSIRFMITQTDWAKKQRFDSFAPVRKKVHAQWLVDGRDYMWMVSRAINMARDVIYIHDWWLSPELYMRRPPAISQKWRLDRLLQRKAQEGVKIFVIMYRNINTAVPIDSEYSKFSLLDLHPNIYVQRSPNQIRQNTFFWAHHEKLCVVDHCIVFMGGLDLCFGRWDTAQHTLVDDKPTGFELDDTPKDADHCQLWPGKDYSNPRVQDFYNLDKPYEEMYDRTQIPRMPWHDIGMQIVGQPARDMARHFVQRWNYLLRQRTPSRPTPFLLPPPDFMPGEIEALGLDGTCEVQILRSASSWSLGTPNKTEHSIMNAYVQMISTSQHFVYIENQFFISSCTVMGTKIENRISDALVDRIKRAHANQEDWRACLIIPLMPGFQNSVDQGEGSSVRLIMTCQYRSICRGESSILGRLRAAGIEPEDYIQFYALRKWGALGPNKALVTEQLYIHAKCMIVDDRVAIIGSANINERSMLGNRDSETAAIVRDTEMIDSYMAGEPYKVGRFPHTLRVRLMREHLGIDVDGIHDDCTTMSDLDSADFNTDASSTMTEAARIAEQKLTENKHRFQDDLIARSERLHSFNHDIDWEQANNPHLVANKKISTDPRIMGNTLHEKDVIGEGVDKMREVEKRPDLASGRDSYIGPDGHEVLVSDVAPEGTHLSPKRTHSHSKGRKRSNTVNTRGSGRSTAQSGGYAGLPPPKLPRLDTRQLGLPQLSQLPALPALDDTDIGGPPLQGTFSGASSHYIEQMLADMRRPIVSEDCMLDPLSDAFYLDTWHTVAENNTKLFRHVFRCQPDNEVTNWKEYKEYAAFAERFSRSQGHESQLHKMQETQTPKTGPPGATTSEKLTTLAAHTSKPFAAIGEKISEKVGADSSHDLRMGKVDDWATEQEQRSRVTSPTSDINEKVPMDDAPRPAADAVVSPISGKSPADVFPFPPPPVPEDTPHDNINKTDSTNLSRHRTVTISEPQKHNPTSRAHANTVSTNAGGSRKGRRRGATKSSTRAFNAEDTDLLLGKEDARRLLELVQGHLVVFPYDWLEKEESTGGWLYAVDQIAPLEIYT